MTLREMLARISAPELGEWRAYERAFGPLDGAWRDEVAASSHEQLQSLALMFAKVNTESDANLPDEITVWPRPDEVARGGEEDQAEEEDPYFAYQSDDEDEE